MKIVIVGCGKIGNEILMNLVQEGHDITAVDNNPDVITELTNMYDIMGVCGSGTDCEVLKSCNIEDAEQFVASTNSDEFNMLSCYLAKKMGAAHVIARIRNPEYNDESLGFLKEQLGLSMAINPELLAAKELFDILKLPSAVKIDYFSRRNFEIVEIILHEGSPLDGISLIDFRKKYPMDLLVCAVQRGEETFIPGGNFVLKSGDRIGITASHSEILKFLKAMDAMQKQAKNVIILGASRTAYYLSKMLVSAGISVKIIEKDLAICEKFSEVLPEAVIIHGDGANQELLLEESISSSDAFVALSGIDEQNILVSYFALSQKVPKVIVKVNRDEFLPTAEKLGLDCIVSARRTISDVIVRYARALQKTLGSKMETLYKVMDGGAEAVEFIVQDDCDVTDKPLKELKLKDNTLIAGIVRKRKVIFPSGQDEIMTGDRVIILTAGYSLNDISDILK